MFKVLDFEVIEVEKSTTTINKYLIWSSFLTLLIVISTFLGWTRRLKMDLDGEKIFTTFTGWKGFTNFNDYHLSNWFLSITSITIGWIVISNSLGWIKNKIKYIIAQLIVLVIYVIGTWQWNHVQSIELRPGLFIIAVATILLVIAYRKKGAK